jgi:hypothetical protein
LADHVTVSFPGGGGGGALRVTVASTTTLLGVPPDVYVPVAARRVAVCDFLYRRFVDVVSPATSPWAVLVPPTTQHGQDQYILERSCISVSAANNGTVAIDVLLANNINGSSGSSSSSDDMRAAARVFVVTTLPALVHRWLAASQLTAPAATQHWQCAEDQEALRALLADRGGVAFVANGAILPRAGGNDDRALASAVPFEAPPTLAVEVTLPHRGRVVGMLVPRGVTVVTGGGYHGKSTLLRAVAVGSYNKVPGDGREYVVTAARSVGIRSEDGRYVSGVDVSPFIDNLPGAAGIDPRNFSTASASGSTSMAANVVEALELQPELFLLDEVTAHARTRVMRRLHRRPLTSLPPPLAQDTCASNFMVRDSRMRSMIANEPITPFIYRVNALYKQKGVSSIVVIGGCGDWFDVQDVTVMMDNYRCLDMSKKARSISKTFCTGRVEFNGRGLVHQVPRDGLVVFVWTPTVLTVLALPFPPPPLLLRSSCGQRRRTTARGTRAAARGGTARGTCRRSRSRRLGCASPLRTTATP